MQYKYIRDSIEHTVIKEVVVHSNAGKTLAVGSGYIDTLTRALKVAQDRMSVATKVEARLTAENMRLQ